VQKPAAIVTATASPRDLGSGPSDIDPMGSPDTAKAMRAHRSSFLQDILQKRRLMVAAMHTILEKVGKNGVLRRALAWGCLAW
jgi:hypothetical protein